MIPYLKEKGKWGGGGVAATPENGEQSVQARSAKPSTATENRKQSARQARDKTIVVQRNQTSKHPCDVP